MLHVLLLGLCVFYLDFSVTLPSIFFLFFSKNENRIGFVGSGLSFTREIVARESAGRGRCGGEAVTPSPHELIQD